MLASSLTGVVCGRVQTIEEIEARRKHEILSMTFYIEQELLRDLTAVLEVLPKHLENQTEFMDQALNKALHDFGILRKEWHARDAKGFNNDSKYKDEIVKAIDFKFKKVIELVQLVYNTDKVDPYNFVHVATRNGNAELITILLSIGFPLHSADNVNYQDDMGETVLATACRVGNFEVFEKLLKAGADANVARRDGKSALQLAIVSDSARSFEMFEALLEAKADVNVINGDGESALHLAVASDSARSFEMFEALLEAKADVSVINGDGESALHLAVASDSARSFEMFETLLKAGADVYVVRRDGASALALAIAGNTRMLNCMPKMIQYDESAESSYVRCLSLAFLAPNHISRWLKDGLSARELLGVLCALMASAVAERSMQDRLSHVRAFINCHIDLLQHPSPLAPLTVTDVVEQLALQASDSVFDSDAAPQWTASIERGVVWVNKPAVQHACRWTIKADAAVRSVAYAADGSKLARAEGYDVVVCDAVSGFQVHRFKGHR
jgi:ankyrin repeat protein